jgi:propionate CoA-transferase
MAFCFGFCHLYREALRRLCGETAMNKVRVLSASEVAALVPDDVNVAVSGFVGAAHPEELTLALQHRFAQEGKPRNLTLVYAAGQGDGETRGLNHLAWEGMLQRAIGGHWNLAPQLGKLALQNKMEAYSFPQGVISRLFREIAAGNPGVITHIGLGPAADPRHGGGKLNSRTKQDLVERVELGGREWLWYKAFPIHIGLVRGTASDSFGNISLENEATIGEALSIAQAARNSGGVTIVQVERLAEDFSRDPKSIVIPGIFVDVVLGRKENHMQTFAEQFNPSYVAQGAITGLHLPPVEEGPRRYISALALRECHAGDVINLGIGMPEGVAALARETNRLDEFTLTVEAGPIGGLPTGGLNFGASVHPMAIIHQPYMFDFYDGGGLDVAVLGMAECDAQGNVNVSKFGGRIAGMGGFINISQTAKKVIFTGTFTVGGLKISFADGKLKIEAEGRTRKFINKVEHLTFSARQAQLRGKTVIYVTERAVFRLANRGLELTEIAPGIDVEKHVLAHMEFRPQIAHPLKIMPAEVFLPSAGGQPKAPSA